MTELWLPADWPAPPGVLAGCTTRRGGHSTPPHAGLNLGDHVEDDPKAVVKNRADVCRILDLPNKPFWLQQVHGTKCVEVSGATVPPEADASWTATPGEVCAVLTADCLPALFARKDGTRVAAAHAGWRGLASGVLEETVGALGCRPGELMVWLGPAIGPRAFEVGHEVRAAFLNQDPGCGSCFVPSPAGRLLADLYELARRRLTNAGVTDVYGGGLCTFSEHEHFYSYRRDGQTGRMASLIWRELECS